ncbi:integrase, catalytic region, zinc finger, CCHC-type containing protein [Tanacetum coccineum]
MVNESLTAELERYKERVAIFEQRLNVDLNKRKKLIDSQIDDLIRNRNAKLATFQQEIDTLKETLSNHVKEKESLSKTLTVFKTESKEKESKYIDKEIVLEKQNKELENIICKMYRSTQAMHMLTKPQVFYYDTHKQALGYQNPFHLKKAQRIQPTLYDGSVIAKAHDVISVFDDEETLILKEESRSKMLDKQNDPISIEKKIKISPIDYSKLNKIKEDFGKRFVTKKELSADQAFWLKHSSFSETPVMSHTPVRMEVPSELPKLQEKDTVIRKLKDRIKSLSGKDSLENVKKDIDEIKTINIETRVQSKEHCDSLIAQINAKSIENLDLNAQLQEKVFAIATLNELRKLKGKNVIDTAVSKPNATIALGMFKLDIEPISHRLQNNRDAHEVYIEKTIENTDTLRGVKPTTNASESKPSGNTKNNRITRPPSSNQKNKVEDHSKKVKSSLNKMNSISEPINNALVKHSVRNAKFESICAIYNKCLFDANHDMCIIDYVNDVNVRLKSKYKKNKIRKLWKPTGKVFTEIEYSWKPTGRNFTIIRNRRPLTRITLNKIVPPKETTIAPVVTPTSRILVYNRKPKATRSVGSSSKVKIVESKTSNSKESKQSWGSTIFDVPSSSLKDCRLFKLFSGIVRFGNDHIPKIMGYGDYQIGNITISWVYYVEGLDEVPEFVIKFLKMIQVGLNAIVLNIKTDNGTEFVNQTLMAYYEEVRISHQTSVAHTPQQNDVVKRQNRTLVEAARTMLIFLKALLFLWAEAVATTCYTQN